MVNILARIDATLAKSEGLNDEQLEAAAVRLLLAEQEVFEHAAEPKVTDAPAPVAKSAAALKPDAAPKDAELYANLEKRAQQEYPSLTTAQAVERLVMANPEAYTSYRKAETDSSDVDAVAIAKGRAGLRNWAQAEAELGILIDDYMHSHRGVNKAQAVAALMKSDRYAQELYVRMRDHRDARVDQVREEAIAKTSSDWNATVSATRAAMPDSSESAVLEAALHKHGTDAGAAATERQQLIAQLHELALTYQREHPDTTYEASYARVCQQGIGYHISQLLKK